MKNEIIPLDARYNIYSIQIDSRNRRLKFLIGGHNYGDYFRRSDILNIEKKSHITRYFKKDIDSIYNVENLTSINSYQIGCCRIPRKLMKSIQNRFKNMK